MKIRFALRKLNEIQITHKSRERTLNRTKHTAKSVAGRRMARGGTRFDFEDSGCQIQMSSSSENKRIKAQTKKNTSL